MGKLIDLTGKRFGQWYVMGRCHIDYVSGEDKMAHTIPQWICKCDCGEVAIVTGNNLRSGQSTCCHKCRDDKRTAGLIAYHRANRKARGENIVCIA